MNNNEPAHCYTDLIRLRAELGKGYTASKFDFARIIEVFLEHNGFKFYLSENGELIGIKDNQIYKIGTNYSAHINFLTYYSKVTRYGTVVPFEKAVLEMLVFSLREKAIQLKNSGSWGYTDFINHEVYFNLNNKSQEIIKINPT